MSRYQESPTRAVPAWPQVPRWTAWEIALLVILLAGAILLRVAMLDQVPPGMQHDEVFDARFATDILNGARPVFFDDNTGVPPLFMYLVAGAFKLLGRNVIALRLTSVTVGILGLFVNYLLLRQLFGRGVALLTLTGLTVSFWHLFDSRVGIEPIVVPLMAGLSFYLFWQALRHGSLIQYGLAGLSMGLSIYSHRAGLLIPLTVVLFVLYLVIARHPWLQGESGNTSTWRVTVGLVLMFLIAAIIVTPMGIHIAKSPDNSMLRVRQLSHHVNALFAGDPRPILGDITGILGMFGFKGDPEWRYNVSGRPVFDLITAVLFWAGVIICLVRIRRPAFLFLLIWLPVNLSMAAITPPSPASTRAIGSIVPIYAMPAISLITAWEWAENRWGRGVKGAIILFAVVLLIGNTAWTVRDYFHVWPLNREVRAIYRADLAMAARYLDQTQPKGAVCISARFAADLDQQTFDYMLKNKRQIKWFDTRQALAIPTLHEEQPITYIFPATDPITPLNRRLLAATGASVEQISYPAGGGAVHVYRLTPAQANRLRELVLSRPEYSLDINLGDEIDLLGYDLPEEVRAGEPIELIVYWQVRRGGRGELSYAFFAHVNDERGFRWAQDDPTGFPPNSWWAGDLVVQTFDLRMPADAPPGRYLLDIGFYEQNSGQRQAQINADGSRGKDFVQLHPLTVTASERPPAASELSITERVDANFGGRIMLLGYDISNRILNLEERIEIALTWEALETSRDDVEIELVLTGEDGQVLPPIHRRLVEGANPLNTWAAGQVVRDRFWLEHTKDIPRAIYDLDIALRDTGSGAYLEIAGGETRVSLGQVFMRGLPK